MSDIKFKVGDEVEYCGKRRDWLGKRCVVDRLMSTTIKVRDSKGNWLLANPINLRPVSAVQPTISTPMAAAPSGVGGPPPPITREEAEKLGLIDLTPNWWAGEPLFPAQGAPFPSPPQCDHSPVENGLAVSYCRCGFAKFQWDRVDMKWRETSDWRTPITSAILFHGDP